LENPVTVPTATATMMATCTGGQRQTTASGTGREITPLNPIETITFSKAMCFIPVPFIMKEITEGVSNDPIELILAVKQATIDFNNTHSTHVGFKMFYTMTKQNVLRFGLTQYQKITLKRPALILNLTMKNFKNTVMKGTRSVLFLPSEHFHQPQQAQATTQAFLNS
jgi:hypothetical protein